MRLLAFAIAFLVSLPAAADPVDPSADELSAREIYEKALQSGPSSGIQQWRLVSTDPAGNEQEIRLEVKFRDYTKVENPPRPDEAARARVLYTAPYDMRGMAFLHVESEVDDGQDFMYSPSTRKVRRILLGEGTRLPGTDVTLDDMMLAAQQVDEANFRRMGDRELEGRLCYVIEVTLPQSPAAPAPGEPPAVSTSGRKTSDFQRAVFYVDQEYLVPLRSRYWNAAGVAIRDQASPFSGVKQFGDTWVPSESIVRNLRENTETRLQIEEYLVNPAFSESELMPQNLGRAR